MTKSKNTVIINKSVMKQLKKCQKRFQKIRNILFRFKEENNSDHQFLVARVAVIYSAIDDLIYSFLFPPLSEVAPGLKKSKKKKESKGFDLVSRRASEAKQKENGDDDE